MTRATSSTPITYSPPSIPWLHCLPSLSRLELSPRGRDRSAWMSGRKLVVKRKRRWLVTYHIRQIRHHHVIEGPQSSLFPSLSRPSTPHPSVVCHPEMLGRLVHLGFDAILISAVLAGVKRSTGLTCVLSLPSTISYSRRTETHLSLSCVARPYVVLHCHRFPTRTFVVSGQSFEKYVIIDR